VNVWEGFGDDKVKALIAGITQAFVDVGVPQDAVHVVVQEVPKSHWGIGGKTCVEIFGPPECEE
ncbi:MAG TPA: tautomerase family protein, partial [Candidatus Lokiarchaeia archaeon]|nr:tautomerase family protein [Candidatus Lokiarchaeia archaeon]